MKSILILGLFVGILSGCAARKDAALSEPLGEKAKMSYDIAAAHYRRGELIPALAAATQAMTEAPQNADVHHLLGLIYFRQAKREQAEASFKEAIRLNPKMTEALNHLGTVYLSQNRFKEAEESFMLAQRNPLYLYPERITNNLGLAFEGQKRLPEAEQAFRESIRLNPTYFLSYMNLGKLLAEQKKWAASLAPLEKSASLCADCAEPRYHLGQTLVALNRVEEAKRVFKRGAELEPESYYGELCQNEFKKD